MSSLQGNQNGTEKSAQKEVNSNHSIFSELVKVLVYFLSTVKGDLANITAPPFFLAPASVVENPRCWAERPKVFCAPSFEPNPEIRSLLVLQLFLVGLRTQLYIAGSPGVSIKKPLNAFLGELFLSSWTDGNCTTRLVSEQVSHHPPITAIHIVDKDHGIRADGYARVEMTFNGTVNIRQIGHTILHVSRFSEDYILPLPDVQVRGLLSACFYPEIVGRYRIVSSSGYVSEIKFSGAGLVRGKKNNFEAFIYHKSDPTRRIYALSGVWSEGWVTKDGRTGQVLKTYTVDAPENEPTAMQIEPIEDQDPWESRRAWRDVIENLKHGNIRAAATAKHVLEEAQRHMRKEEAARGENWIPLFFRSLRGDSHQVFHRLTKGLEWNLADAQTKGVWKIDDQLLDEIQKPYHGRDTPWSP
ncbi:uncharacterized protein NECHADRAFT_97899 [Fusarium vanettenii 77-13-4]|uniref:Oxysterol-binding protein n=1 Tax=Fusarium vanettenii (strain ATCC MYA-4622 / CBS 123669 / FGSC 9596 / NRRL 45880 / 77-13-4) TaxID=660122 RepID=C7ZJX6_FUSV7|nr:uncharacterized protein NECHADRAFT_97899 [Fusarium vanettenii 77-13-4]EEU35668.1 hypothetical protein NECHADRAFT_97899 [Fusarium vanettenii 77-13-4]